MIMIASSEGLVCKGPSAGGSGWVLRAHWNRKAKLLSLICFKICCSDKSKIAMLDI
jgi:hypothetical protein